MLLGENAAAVPLRTIIHIGSLVFSLKTFISSFPCTRVPMLASSHYDWHALPQYLKWCTHLAPVEARWDIGLVRQPNQLHLQELLGKRRRPDVDKLRIRRDI